MTEIPADKHGTYTGYKHYKCRCEDCREANRLRGIAYRSSMTKEIPADKHGTNYGYRHYGCRCTRCKQAGADYHYQTVTKPRLLANMGRKRQLPYRPNLAALELIEAAREAFSSDTGYAIAIAGAASRGPIAQQVRYGTRAAPTREEYGFYNEEYTE